MHYMIEAVYRWMFFTGFLFLIVGIIGFACGWAHESKRGDHNDN